MQIWLSYPLSVFQRNVQHRGVQREGTVLGKGEKTMRLLTQQTHRSTKQNRIKYSCFPGESVFVQPPGERTDPGVKNKISPE